MAMKKNEMKVAEELFCFVAIVRGRKLLGIVIDNVIGASDSGIQSETAKQMQKRESQCEPHRETTGFNNARSVALARTVCGLHENDKHALEVVWGKILGECRESADDG